MSKRYKIPPVNFQDFKDKREEEGAIPIVIGDRTFIVRPPEQLADDDLKRFFELEDQDPVAQARMMMDNYDDFVALGGSAMLLMSIIQEVTNTQSAEQGASPGESEASSTS